MDVSNYPPDMCPLCRQRALSLDGTTLDCTACHARADFDISTRRIRYASIPKRYEQFEAALQDKWLSRVEAFEATELKPLPAVVFFPVIVSLLALCALFGLIGVGLAVRPSASSTRQIIEDAYARQFGAAPSMESPLITQTVQVTATVEITITPEEGTLEAMGTATALALQNGGAPPAEVPTAGAVPTIAVEQPAQPTPAIPTQAPLPPTFTPEATAELPPTPTATPPVVAVPTTDPNSSQQSPLPLPPSPTATATNPPDPNAPPGTPTSTATQSSQPSLGPVIITGTVAITNVNAAAGSAFDEYIDIFNTSTTPVNLINWKVRIGGQVYNLSNPPDSQLQLLGQQGCRVFSGTNVGPVALPGEYVACGARFIGITSGQKIYPNTSGYQVELLNENNVAVAYYGR